MIYLKLIYYSIGKRDVTIKKCNCFYLKREKGTWYNGYQRGFRRENVRTLDWQTEDKSVKQFRKKGFTMDIILKLSEELGIKKVRQRQQ